MLGLFKGARTITDAMDKHKQGVTELLCIHLLQKTCRQMCYTHSTIATVPRIYTKTMEHITSGAGQERAQKKLQRAYSLDYQQKMIARTGQVSGRLSQLSIEQLRRLGQLAVLCRIAGL